MADVKYGLNFGNSNKVDTTSSVKNGYQNNQIVPEPVSVTDNSTNFWYNNKNWDPVTLEKVSTGIFLETLGSVADNPYLTYASMHVNVAPRSGSTKYTMLRQRSMSVVTDPIREGQLPQKLTFSLEEVGVTCSSYAAYVEYTNDFVERNPIDGLQRLTKGLADSAALSLLVITRETLYLAASKAYTGDAASLDGLTTGLTLAGLQAITNQMWEDKVDGINGQYVVLLGREGMSQLKLDPTVQEYQKGWTDSSVTGNPYEVGYSCGDIRLVQIREDKRVKRSDGTDVNVAFIIGKDAYVTVGTNDTSGIEFIHKPLGSAGTADPTNQYGTVAYVMKSVGVAVIRGEAIYALHYPRMADAIQPQPIGGHFNPSTGEWVPGKYTGGSIIDPSAHTMGSLVGSSEADMATIWDGTAVYPRPYEGHKKWVEAQSDAAKVQFNSPIAGRDISNATNTPLTPPEPPKK